MSDTAPNPNGVKQGDTEPLVVTLVDAKGTVDLATAQTAEFRMASKTAGEGHAPISAPADILQHVDGVTGKTVQKGQVQYVWGAGETDTPGTYGVEFAITFSNGKVRTFPNDRQTTFEIFPKAA